MDNKDKQEKNLIDHLYPHGLDAQPDRALELSIRQQFLSKAMESAEESNRKGLFADMGLRFGLQYAYVSLAIVFAAVLLLYSAVVTTPTDIEEVQDDNPVLTDAGFEPLIPEVYAVNSQTSLYGVLPTESEHNFPENGTLNLLKVQMLEGMEKAYNYISTDVQLQKGSSFTNCAGIYPYLPDATRLITQEYYPGDDGIFFTATQFSGPEVLDSFVHNHAETGHFDGENYEEIIIELKEGGQEYRLLDENVEYQQEAIILRRKLGIDCEADGDDETVVEFVEINRENFLVKSQAYYLAEDNDESGDANLIYTAKYDYYHNNLTEEEAREELKLQ
jgi:hypothetical protein